ncbi:Molybdopterin synthase sulfur carrier subunit [hydrothermal vent metagenome]|uniref:Molybdopterin synthase sulfur carrier subunit n=1 Tax=hydrothermal vent metagenome TaxID=652676 RepID=A0A3B0WCC9_9ZZZZ
MIHILYFAHFRELLGQSEEKMAANHATVSDLLAELATRGNDWKCTLVDNGQLQIAVNHNVASRETPIKAGDEIAFFPPVTGG